MKHLCQHAAQFADQWEVGTIAHGTATDFDWFFHPAIPLTEFAGSVMEWKAFYEQEKQFWAIEGEPDRFDELENDWLSGKDSFPLVAVRGPDQKLYLWDGNHRMGISHTLGKETVPVIIGIRKDKQ